MHPQRFLEAYPEYATIESLPPRSFKSEAVPGFATELSELFIPTWEKGLMLGHHIEGFLRQDPNDGGALSPLSYTDAEGNTVKPRFEKDIRDYYRGIIQDGKAIGHGMRKIVNAAEESVLKECLDSHPNRRMPRKLSEIKDEDVTEGTLNRIRAVKLLTEEAAVEAAFHQLTLCFMPMWKPLLDGEWPKHHTNTSANYDKIWWITHVQQDIALHGMQELNRRRRMVSAEGQDNYFSKANSLARGFIEGKGAEFDVAIQLLEAVKQAMEADPELELTVIPAPPQFEASNYRNTAQKGQETHKPKNPNVDFLVINLRTRQVAGVQVKATRGGKERSYDIDSGRVTILYGEDIAPPIRVGEPNYRQFTKSGQPVIHQKLHPWYGRLCVAIMQDVPTYGPDAARVFKWRDVQNGFSAKDGSRLSQKPNGVVELPVFKNQMRMLARVALTNSGEVDRPDWRSMQRDLGNPAIDKILAEVGVVKS
ncbi:hypothetical protein JNM87_00370 [Candidatus Saccharibacteria bacterium]|nr:hypothetical protein [Candidatus Saccharibacteria bacterium]